MAAAFSCLSRQFYSYHTIKSLIKPLIMINVSSFVHHYFLRRLNKPIANRLVIEVYHAIPNSLNRPLRIAEHGNESLGLFARCLISLLFKE